jgi:four helix bundle protein
MRENIIQDKSFQFAVKSINIYKTLQSRREFVLSKQLLRSGTSVGANIRESANAQSKADFVHKLHISQKECAESIYWLDLLKETEYITLEEYSNLQEPAKELLKIIRSIILTTKQNMNTANS